MITPGSANPLLMKSAAATSYTISRSLRFNSADSANCTRTAGTPTSSGTWTFSVWIKRATLGADTGIIGGRASGTATQIYFKADNTIRWYENTADFSTTAVFRDASSWYHFVFTKNGSTSCTIYVNGVQLQQNTTGVPSTSQLNASGAELYLGAIPTLPSGVTFYAGHYYADVHFIDGQALTPTSFGEFDATTGVWNPKAYTGTYGTNGFHLDFADNSAATATTLGKDSSGNGNNWTPNNIFAAGSASGGTVSIATVASTGFVAGGTTLEMVDNSTATYYNAANGGLSFASPITAAFSSIVSRGAGGNCWLEFYNSSNSLIYTSPTISAPVGSVITIGPYVVSGVAKVIAKSNATGVSSDGHGIYGFRINASLVNTNSNSSTSFSYPTYSEPGNDSLVDSPTNYGTDTGVGGEVRGNYCTLNPLNPSTCTLANGNLECTTPVSGSLAAHGTFNIPTSGKWYWEFVPLTNGFYSFSGVINRADTSKYVVYWGNTGTKYINGVETNYGSAFTTNAVIGVAVNSDAGTITFYKNNVSQGAITQSFASGDYTPFLGDGTSDVGVNFVVNFGQRPFAYTAPSGFKALCTANLPAPTISKGSSYFDTVLWSGSGGNRSITGLSLSPDLVWIKQRNIAYTVGHQIYDVVRGAGSLKQLDSSNTTAEGGGNTNQYGYLSSFDSAGFSLATGSVDSDYINKSGITYAAWCWDAGSSTVTNTAGTISSQVRANASSGFSVVSYTGSGANATIGHGLGVAPSFIIVKARGNAYNWQCYHSSLGAAFGIQLNLTNASAAETTFWNSTSPTSTVFSVGTSVGTNQSSATYIAYCFAPVASYSAFGSYTGNGSANGPFVFCGFRPRWVMAKCTSTTGDWHIIDSSRLGYNPNKALYANATYTEGGEYIDLLSNGFRLNASYSGLNASGATFIYAAFAENPFSLARAR